MDTFAFQYGYLIGSLILGCVWLIFYLFRRDLRKELIWISSIMAVAGVTEKFFVPVYWNPGSLFDLINNIGFGIESFLFAFFAGGVAGVTYEFFARKHLRKGRFSYTNTRLIPLLFFFVLLALMIYKNMSIHLYSLIIPALFVSVLIAFYRRDLIKEILFGGLYFAILYLVLFIFFYQLFPNYISDAYNVGNLWEIYIFGIPLEEVIFAFSIGAMLSPMYEYIQGYRLYSYRALKVLK